nr:hypothetical protein BaRGS_024309 [Batillaria attramentaria]
MPGDNQSDIVKRTLTLAMIAEKYPEAWIQVYTDGAATDAVSNGGAGVSIRFPDQAPLAICLPTGKFCSNYAAEVKALERAAAEIYSSTSDCQQVVFLTDALSVLEALSGNSLEQLSTSLGRVSLKKHTVLQTRYERTRYDRTRYDSLRQDSLRKDSVRTSVGMLGINDG